MKSIICFLVVLFFCSCSQSLEKKAKEQMEKTMKELAKDPSSVSFNDVKVMYDNDSICILNVKMSAKNGFGAITSSDYEYVYLIDRKDSVEFAREIVRDLKDKESVMSMARKDYQKKEWTKGSKIDLMSDEEKKAFYIYYHAYLTSIFGGRKVNYDKNDVENW